MAAPPLPQQLPFKLGESFEATVDVLDLDTNLDADLTDVTVASQIWNGKVKVADLEVVWVDRAHGLFDLISAVGADTKTWPVGNLKQDIVFSKMEGGRLTIKATETFYILTEGPVTK